MVENYSMRLNELLRASCPPPFESAEPFKFIPDELVRRNMTVLGNCSLRCSIAGTPDRYLPVGDQSTLFAIFPLIFVPFMQYAG